MRELSEKTYGGGTPSTTNAEYWYGNIPWLQSSDITDGKLFDVIPKKYISQLGLNSSAAQLVPENSIAIITRVGVGKLAFLPFSYTTSQDFLSMSQLKTEPYFTVYACYKKLQSEINSVQGTSIKGITKNELLAKEISIPLYAEQTKIGAYFRCLDNLITIHQRKLILLNKYKKGLLLSVFTSFSKDKIISLKELIDKNIIEIKRGNIIPKQNGIYPVYSSSIQNNGLFCYSETYMFNEELISWSIDGGGNFFYRPEHKFSLTNVTGYIKVKNKNILNTQYLYYNLDYLSHSYNFDYQNKALPSYISKLYKIYLPPIKVQEKTAKILSTFDELIEKENNILSLLKQYKQGLLQQMFI